MATRVEPIKKSLAKFFIPGIFDEPPKVDEKRDGSNEAEDGRSKPHLTREGGVRNKGTDEGKIGSGRVKEEKGFSGRRLSLGG